MRWGCLSRAPSNQVGMPGVSLETRRRGLRGRREKGKRQGDRERIMREEGEEQTFGECPFVLLSWQLMLGSDILRGSGDSFGDIPVCDSMTNLCLYLILESVETAQRMAVWDAELQSAGRAASSCFAQPPHRHQGQCPRRGGGLTHRSRGSFGAESGSVRSTAW